MHCVSWTKINCGQLHCSFSLSLRIYVSLPHSHPLWRQHSRFITCEISRPFLHFLTAPIRTLSLHTHTISHTQTHTRIHLHSSHLLTVTIHLSLAVAKLQAPTKFFFFFAANKSFAFTTALTDTPFCWSTLFLILTLFSWLCPCLHLSVHLFSCLSMLWFHFFFSKSHFLYIFHSTHPSEEYNIIRCN